jgi:4-amino-4-deoxy-L-arabinose transferase-like glycosyltransferase
VSARRSLWWIALAALALRLVLVVARGDYIVYDEGYYLLLARSLRAGQGFTLNGLPHVALSPLQPVLVAVLSAAGIPDLWASRLLAAACGALLVFPITALARLAGGERAALPAAVLVGVSPALMSFVPFFPGQSWNLYFGSEPLFLLLAFGAVAAAVRAEDGGWGWWATAGVLAAGSYLTRAEGAVLGPALFLVLAVRVGTRRRPHGWPRLALAVCAAAVVAAPYLWYLRSTLGRWALSGRVQAAETGGSGATGSAVGNARAGGEVLDAFVWQGQPEAFLRALYGLDRSGTGMASQYWGVHRETAAAGMSAAAPDSALAGAPPPPGAAAVAPEAPATARRGTLDVWRRGLGAVVPWWLGVLAIAGLMAGGRQALVWLFPLAVSALLPSVLTYVEPRSLLPLAPLAALYAAAALVRLEARLPSRWRSLGLPTLTGVVSLALVAPAARELVRAWPQTAPLQQVSVARRVVGEYLGSHLPPNAAVMSWHPAIAIWARRPWRVLPFDSFQRIARYARGQGVAAIVFSRFEPSPLREPPRPFTVILPGAVAADTGARIEVQPVDETPLLFVGRLAPGPDR